MSHFARHGSRRNPCPVCDGARNDCRSNIINGITHCRSLGNAPTGWGYIGEDSLGFGMYAPDRQDDRQQELQERRDRQRQEQADRRAALTSPQQRDKVYRRLLPSQRLTQAHRAELHRRGLNDEAITLAESQGWLKSWSTGITVYGQTANIPGIRHGQTAGQDGLAIAAIDLDGRIVGHQVNPDRPMLGAKYPWLSEGNGHLPGCGEMPLALWQHPDRPVPVEIWIAEGYLKSLIVALMAWAAGRTGVVVIGPGGCNWASHPKQLRAAIDRLQPTSITLLPDTGWQNNPHVANQVDRLAKLLPGMAIADWGQGQAPKTAKLDPDEVGITAIIASLPKGDLWITGRYLDGAQIPLDKRWIDINLPTGMGKTMAIADWIDRLEAAIAPLGLKPRILSIVPLERLGLQNAERFGMAYRLEWHGQDAIELRGLSACVHSLHPDSQLGFDALQFFNEPGYFPVVIADEHDQTWEQLSGAVNMARTQSAIVPQVFTALKIALTQGCLITASATSQERDLALIQALSGVTIAPYRITGKRPEQRKITVYRDLTEEDDQGSTLLKAKARDRMVACLRYHIRYWAKWGRTILISAEAQKCDSTYAAAAVGDVARKIFAELEGDAAKRWAMARWKLNHRDIRAIVAGEFEGDLGVDLGLLGEFLGGKIAAESRAVRAMEPGQDQDDRQAALDANRRSIGSWLRICVLDSQTAKITGSPGAGLAADEAALNAAIDSGVWDVIAFSPVITSGISITTGAIDSYWVLAGSHAVPITVQRAGRVRSPQVPIHLALPDEAPGPTHRSALELQADIAGKHERYGWIMGEVATGRAAKALERYRCERQAERTANKDCYADAAIEAFEADGWQVIQHSPTAKQIEGELHGCDAVRAMLRSSKVLRIEHHCQSVERGDLLTKQVQRALELAPNCSEHEWYSIEKTKLHERYSVPVTAQLAALDLDRNFYRRARLAYFATGGREFLPTADRNAYNRLRQPFEHGPIDPTLKPMRATLADRLYGGRIEDMEAIGFGSIFRALDAAIARGELLEFRSDDPTITAIADQVRANPERWGLVADGDKDLAIVNDLLRRELGCPLYEQRREGARGEQVRIYGFCPPAKKQAARAEWELKLEIWGAWLARDTAGSREKRNTEKSSFIFHGYGQDPPPDPGLNWLPGYLRQVANEIQSGQLPPGEALKIIESDRQAVGAATLRAALAAIDSPALAAIAC